MLINIVSVLFPEQGVVLSLDSSHHKVFSAPTIDLVGWLSPTQ